MRGGRSRRPAEVGCNRDRRCAGRARRSPDGPCEDARVRPVYRMIDHTADLAFEIEGADWPGLLERATAALGDVILADDGRPPDAEVPVAAQGADREDVLVAWLSAAALAYEDRGLVPRGARFDRLSDREARGVVLSRRTDPGTEPPDRVVKAVTYHDLHVRAGGGGLPWRATIVLDL